MPQLLDPIVGVLTREFNAAIEILCSQKHPNDSSVECVRQLCELSRDAKFNLGSRQFSNAEQREDLAKSLENGVKRILALWEPTKVPKDVQAYCENLTWRANRIREGS